MRKVLWMVVVAMLFCVPVFAVNLDGNEFWSYVIENTTGAYQNTLIPITSVVPGSDRILGYEHMPLPGQSAENVVAVFDTVNYTTFASAEVLGESECQDGSWDGMWFPYPRTISYGVTVRQGAGTRVIVYFVRG